MASPAAKIAELKNAAAGSKQIGVAASAPPVSVARMVPQAIKTGSHSRFKLLEFKSLAEVFKSLVTQQLLDDVHSAKEIPIFIPGGSFDSANMDKYTADDLLAIDGNKLFDVLAFIALIMDIKRGNAVLNDIDFFDIKDGSIQSEQNYLTNMKCLAFSYMLVMTRGYLPRQTGSGCDNALPKLLLDNIDTNGKKTEKDFAAMLSGANLSKIKVNWMVKLSPSEFPDPIKNRIMKGTAGSRALKIISQAFLIDNDGSVIEESNLLIFLTLAELAQKSNCYLNLHPMVQIVQNKIEQFYKSCIALSFTYVGEKNVPKLISELKKIQSFNNDQVLTQMSYMNNHIMIGGSIFNHSFTGMTPSAIESLFGNPLV